LKSYLVKLLIITFTVLTVCMSRGLYDTYQEYKEVRAAHQDLEEKLVFERYENSQLDKELISQKQMDALYEDIARSELKMVHQGEEVFIIKLP